MGAKRKTINKVIREKINDWISSIEDKELRKDVEKDVIVTGGCITSLFLGEKVKDFDVYFKTLNTAYKVSKYYADSMDYDIKVQVVECDDQGIPISYYENDQEVFKNYANDVSVMNYTPVEGEEVKYRVRCFVISDGVVGDPEREDTEEDEILKDIGLKNENDGSLEESNKYNPVFITSNAITLSDNLQIVIRFFGEPDIIHENYDFQHVTNYWTYETGLVTNERALECILSKELLYRGSRYPLASIIRTRKFIQRGWKINAGQYIKMVYQLNQMDLNDPKVLEQQLTGVDIAYMHAVLVELKNKVNESPNMDIRSYFLSVVEKIFD